MRRPALAARLAYVGLVAREDGDRLQKGLPVGARLVSREGDLWRWDGFVARAEAPRPAAVRMAQKTRLAELEAEIDKLTPAAAEAASRSRAAADALRPAEEAVRARPRGAPPEAERALGAAREAMDALAREAARREARAQSLDETIARFEGERVEADELLAVAETEAEARARAEILMARRLAEARQVAAVAREAASAARAALDFERRERDGRQRRLEGVARDSDDWTRRCGGAAAALEALAERPGPKPPCRWRPPRRPRQVEGRKTKLLDD